MIAPWRLGWAISPYPDLQYTHDSGARIELERLPDDYIQWWAVTGDGTRLGPFTRFAEAFHVATPEECRRNPLDPYDPRGGWSRAVKGEGGQMGLPWGMAS